MNILNLKYSLISRVKDSATFIPTLFSTRTIFGLRMLKLKNKKNTNFQRVVRFSHKFLKQNKWILEQFNATSANSQLTAKQELRYGI